MTDYWEILFSFNYVRTVKVGGSYIPPGVKHNTSAYIFFNNTYYLYIKLR